MADVRSLLQRLAVEPKLRPALEAKANEFVRVATARLGSGGLGQGELCKGAACVELACTAAGVALDTALVSRFSGVNDKVYRNTRAALQKLLGVGAKATARDLCIQFGCARHEPAVRAALAAYKERFVRSLPAAQRGHVDFGRPVFLAAAFFLVARKNKVAVDRLKLLGPLGATASEFAQACASMADLCTDLVGTTQRKRAAEDVAPEHRALIDRTGPARDDAEASSSDDEVEDDGQVGYRINPKKQRQRDYAEWKERVLAKPKEGGGAAKAKREPLTERKLRQAVLGFAAATAPAAAPAAGVAPKPPAAEAAPAAGKSGTAAQQARQGTQAGSAAQQASQQAGAGRKRSSRARSPPSAPLASVHS